MKAKPAMFKAVLLNETSIRKAAARLLPVGPIVSTEVQYLLRTMNGSVSEEQLDASILAVRKMPWAQIVEPE